MRFAHTAVFPVVQMGDTSLCFFCDLTRPAAIAEILATCDTWLDLKLDSLPPPGVDSEDKCYEWAGVKMRATLIAIGEPSFRNKVLTRAISEFLTPFKFFELREALTQYYANEDRTRNATQPQFNRCH